MKIQFLNGGLANQAFQYIFARYYELSHPGEIMYMDDSYFAINKVHNGYELEKVFGIKPHMLSECFDDDVWSEFLEQKRNGKSIPEIMNEFGADIYMISEVSNFEHFNPFTGKVLYIKSDSDDGNMYFPELQEETGNIYYHGYWINKGWFNRFKEQFLKEFSFTEIEDETNRKYMRDIRNSNSLSIHIRRGDFTNLGIDLKVEYYKEKVLKTILETGNDWVVYVFSDDIEWCKRNSKAMCLDLFKDIIFVDCNSGINSYRDLELMSNCKGMIVSNSSFAYLAALLNTRKEYVISDIKNRQI